MITVVEVVEMVEVLGGGRVEIVEVVIELRVRAIDKPISAVPFLREVG